MKKFLQIYGGWFLALPVLFCLVVYLVGCFLSWSILEVDIQWGIVRAYMLFSVIPSFFLAGDK